LFECGTDPLYLGWQQQSWNNTRALSRNCSTYAAQPAVWLAAPATRRVVRTYPLSSYRRNTLSEVLGGSG
jgi:hypothetical protein